MTNKSTLAQGLSHAWPWTKPIGSSPTTSRLLRYSLLCMLVLLCGGSVWAQDVTYDLTDESWSVSNGKLTNGTVDFSGKGDANFKMNDGYFMMGKSDAYINFPTYDKAVTKIVITGRSGASGGVKQNIFVGKEAVSTETTGATGTNTYEIASDYQAAGTQYTLKVTSNHNTQITKIEVYFEDASDTRTQTVLLFDGEYQTTGEVGGSMELPTTLVKTVVDGVQTGTLNEPTITWESSNTAVATIEGSSIKLLKAGTAKITATYAGDVNYKGSTTDFTITVSAAIQDGVFDFNSGLDYGSGLAPSSENTYITEAKTWTAGNVTLVTSGKYRWWATDNTLRIFDSGDTNNPTSLTISVPAEKTITKIVISGSSINNLSSNVGTYSKGTWTGNAQSVTLVRGGDNAQIKTITVTYTSASVPDAPTFSPAGGTYEEPQAVVLSTTTDEATIYYSTDGEIFSVYSGAISVTETTTISAYTKKGEEESATVTATYTINPPITTIADLNAAAIEGGTSGASVKFKFTDIYVAYAYGSYNYITDGTNYALLYGSSLDLTAGDQISGSLTGNAKVYNGLPEIVVTASDLSILSQTAGAFTPEASIVTVDQLSDNVNKFIKIEKRNVC